MHESLNLKAHYIGSFANGSCNSIRPFNGVKKQALFFKEAQLRLSLPDRDFSSLEADAAKNALLKRRFKRLARVTAIQSKPLTPQRPWRVWEQESVQLRQFQRHCVPQPRNTPPKRDTGIASEKEWGINLENQKVDESGVNEDGSSWYQEGGEDLGENGYRCRWTVMGGSSAEGSCEWREAWWEKSDSTGYKELGAEKSGKNSQGDSWWETWQEILRQDEWSNLARIERNAQKQAQSGNGAAGWYEKWWEKYNAKGWTEKGAHKYGRLNEQSWWEKWGEQYDGRGAVLKWTDKWAETEMGTKWGDKWEEKFFSGMGTKQGETWHSSSAERWSRTWGEEHFGNGTIRKYGRSTSGESWDTLVEEGTYYESEPHYGWADAIGNSAQLLAIEVRGKPPGIYPDLDFGIPSKSGQASPTPSSQFQDLPSPPIPPSPPSPPPRPPRPIASPIPPPRPPPPSPSPSPSPPPPPLPPSPPTPPPPPFLEE